jgi:hypothetical protein
MRPSTGQDKKTNPNCYPRLDEMVKKTVSSYFPFISGHGGGAHTPAPPEAVEQVQYIDGKELLYKIIVKLFPEKELRGSVPTQSPHSCVCELFMYSQVRSTYFPAAE